jgi:tetratricopeptide (TPR) repeat protein
VSYAVFPVVLVLGLLQVPDARVELQRHEEVIARDSTNYTSLWNASAYAVTLGEFEPDAAKQKELYARSERYARRAVAVNPNDAEGHFALSRAIGRIALSLGPRDRVKYAVEVREQALAAIAANPKHDGALHVLALWHQNVMQLNSVARFMAKNLLGGKVFSEASWENALSNLEQATALRPDVIIHQLDLGRLYALRKRNAEAREHLQLALDAPLKDPNDEHYKKEAEAALKALK